MEFVDVDANHCINAEDDFEFVTEDVERLTDKGRQCIDGKSHHPNATFKSILFGEQIRSRQINKRKENCFASLNRLK